MSSKKSKSAKLLVVSGAMFASSLVAINPQQAGASSNVEALVKNAENLANALKWEISYDHRKIAYPKNVFDYPNMKLFNETKAAMFAAEKALTNASGNQKQILKARLDQNVKTHYDRAVRYIDSVTAGKKILAKSDVLKEKLTKNSIDDSTENAYHALSREIKRLSPIMYKTYGKSTRDALVNYYQGPAYETKDDALYPVSIKIEIDRLNKALAEKHTDKSIHHTALLEKYFVDGTEKGLLKEGSVLYTKLSDSYKASYENFIKLVPVLKAESKNINSPTVVGGTANAIQKYENTIVITAGKGQYIKLANAEVNGNIVIKGDHTGAGTVYLENVKVNKVNNYGGAVIVEDVAEHSLYLTNTNATNLQVNDSNDSNIVMISGRINAVNLAENAGARGGITLESRQKGALGQITIASKGTQESKGVTLSGDFSDSKVILEGLLAQVKAAADAKIKEMEIVKQARIEAAKGAYIESLNLALKEKGELVDLQGDFSRTTVNILNANATIQVAKDTQIKEVRKDPSVPGNVSIINNGTIETATGVTVGNNPPTGTTPPSTGGGSSSGGGGGSTTPVQTTASVADINQLQAALENEKIKTINITKDIPAIDKAIVIDRAVTINGNGKKLSFTDALNGLGNGERQGILVNATGTKINGLSIEMTGANGWQGVYGIQVYNATGVVINNYKGTGADAALLVNASEVTLTGTTTVTGNEFGGVEVSKGKGENLTNSKLTVNGTFVNRTEAFGKPTIWLVKEEGTIIGTNVPATKNEEIKDNQIQYYLNEESLAVANVSNLDELNSALGDSSITSINITADIENISKRVTVSRAVTINGGGHALSFKGLEGLTNDVNDGLTIMAEATINNLVVDAGLANQRAWKGVYAIQAYNTTATLNNVTATGGNGGILVNNSNVTLTGAIDVSNNGYGGIEVSNGDPLLDVTKATIINSSEAYGLPSIWEDGVTGKVVKNLNQFIEITKDGQPQYYVSADAAVSVNVSSITELETALENEKIKMINITSNIQDLEKRVTVDREVTINGGGHTLSFKGLEGLTNDVNDGLTIIAEATINNLVVDAGLSDPKDWKGAYAIHAYNTTATLNNVKATGGNGGILVNNSKVKLTGIVDVSNNGFGGIEVSNGDPSLDVTKATIINSSEAYGLPSIWEDRVSDTIETNVNQFTKVTKGNQPQYYIIAENSLSKEQILAKINEMNIDKNTAELTTGLLKTVGVKNVEESLLSKYQSAVANTTASIGSVPELQDLVDFANANYAVTELIEFDANWTVTGLKAGVDEAKINKVQALLNRVSDGYEATDEFTKAGLQSAIDKAIELLTPKPVTDLDPELEIEQEETEQVEDNKTEPSTSESLDLGSDFVIEDGVARIV